MKNFIQYIIHNKGGWIGAAMLLSKITSLLIIFITARLVSSTELGEVLYALNFLGFFLPMVGLGSYQGSLRYGLMTEDISARKLVVNYSFYYGILGQFLLTIIMILLSFIFIKDININFLVAVFGVRLIGLYLMEQAKADLRALDKNKKFALVDIYFSVISLFLSVGLTYFFGVKGYITAMCIAPFFILFFYRFQFKKVKIPFNEREFWKFCIFTAFTIQIWQWVFLLDVFFVGYFFSKSDVSYYKLSSMIPFNLIFLSQMIMQTEYPNFCKNQRDKNYFIKFLKNYYALFAVISALVLSVSFIFSKEIMLLFGKEYQNTEIFMILIYATVSCYFFRIPFGYMLPSRGKSFYTLLTAIVSLLVLSIFSYYFHQPFGVEGIAYASLISLTVSGVFSMFLFFYSFESKLS